MTPKPHVTATLNPVLSEAEQYAEAGFWITPLKHASKQAVLQNWQNVFVTPDRVPSLFTDTRNLGLLLGKPTGSFYLYAIDVDVDDPVVLYAVEQAIGPGAPQKRGKKGMTFIMTSKDTSYAKAKIKSKGARQNPGKPMIEILGDGNQTVLPPSVHPETNAPYEWVNFSLLSQHLHELPAMTPEIYSELFMICKEPDSPIMALNAMTWAGVGNGGDTHDVCVAAVASMVARGWCDDAIFARVSRAKRSACERAGMDYDWPEEFVTIQSWIDSSRAKGHDANAPDSPRTGSGSSRVPKVRRMGDWIISHVGGEENMWKYEGSLRYYRDGHWVATDDAHLAASLSRAFDDATGNDMKHALTTAYMCIPPENPPPLPAVCLKNGAYEALTHVFRDWSKADKLMHQLPFSYDAASACPHYDAQMLRIFEQHHDETFEEDTRTDEELHQNTLDIVHMVEEFFALTLVNDMRFQKALIIRGSPGGGKSVLAQILQYMHGEGVSDAKNVASVPLSDLGDERSRTALVGKLVNIGSELDATKPINVPYFKAITGGDAVPIRSLYKDMNPNVKLPTRFVVFCNEIPPYRDSSGAMERRLLIAPADNPIPPDQHIPDYFERFLVPEMPGIFNRWMEALRRLYARNRFSPPASSKREVKSLQIENDGVRQWIADRLDVDSDGKLLTDQLTASSELYADYAEWCKSTYRSMVLAQTSWGRHLSHAGVPPVATRVGKKVLRCRRVKLVNGGEY
jgi:P4 family phage/plasmid primase-like protien